MHSQAVRASSHVSLCDTSRRAETQRRGNIRAVCSQSHAVRGQQVGVRSRTASRAAGRSARLYVAADIEKPKLPYDVGGQGGVGVLSPTLEPVSGFEGLQGCP